MPTNERQRTVQSNSPLLDRYGESVYGEPDFRQGTSTDGGSGGGDTDTYDPNYGKNPDDGVIDDPPPEREDPGDGTPSPVTAEPVPETEGVPEFTPEDYSGEVGQDRPDIGGAMDYNVPQTNDVPFVTSSGTADPTMTPWEVTSEQTVMGLSEEYYDRDSPFFETARQRAIRQSQASGGQNSAMAGAFGELAAMDQVFKMAQQDAMTYARSAEFNATMSNQFSLAEQRFVHNALLSDQSYRQAAELQTQRIAGQMEAIVLDYKGRSVLMDQEMSNWMLQAKQAHQYQIDLLYEQGSLAEGQAGRDFSRSMVLNGMNTMTNFYTNAFAAVMQYANNPSFTPEQQRGAMENGMAWASSQWEMLQRYWGQWAAGGPPLQSFTGTSNGWYDFSTPYTGG